MYLEANVKTWYSHIGNIIGYKSCCSYLSKMVNYHENIAIITNDHHRNIKRPGYKHTCHTAFFEQQGNTRYICSYKALTFRLYALSTLLCNIFSCSYPIQVCNCDSDCQTQLTLGNVKRISPIPQVIQDIATVCSYLFHSVRPSTTGHLKGSSTTHEGEHQ